MNIYSTLLQIAATGVKQVKQDLLEDLLHTPMGPTILRLAYDKALSFWMTSVEPCGDGPTATLGQALEWLESEVTTRHITGEAARSMAGTYYEVLSEDDQKVFLAVISRDLRCGISVASINKAAREVLGHDLIQTYPYMRCSLLSAKTATKIQYPCFSQMKADGMYATADNGTNRVVVRTRAGNQVFGLPEELLNGIATLLEALASQDPADGTAITLNGELLIQRDGQIQPREVGNGIFNSLTQGRLLPSDCTVLYQVWDYLPTARYVEGAWAVPYHTRFASLEAAPSSDSIILIETKVCMNFKEAMAHYRDLTGKGYEGTVIKNFEGIWKGHTSPNQLKVKVSAPCELIMCGLTAGTGKNARTFGSITCRTSDGLLKVDVNGRDDAMRDYIFDNWASLRGQVITVEFNGITVPNKDGVRSLFLPVALELRPDRTEADTLDRVQAQLESAILVGRLKSKVTFYYGS